MPNISDSLLQLVRQLYDAPNPTTVQELLHSNQNRLTPELHQLMRSLQDTPGWDANRLQIIINMSLPAICQKTLLSFIALEESQQYKVAGEWIVYLTESSAYCTWELVERSESFSHLRQNVSMGQTIVEYFAVLRLFYCDALQDAEQWAVHAQYYLLSPTAFIQGFRLRTRVKVNEIQKGLAFLAWGKLHYNKRPINNKHADTHTVCFRFALEHLSMNENPVEWADAKICLGRSLISTNLQNTEILQEAIESFKSSFQVYSDSFYPERWGLAHYHLSILSPLYTTGPREEHLKESLEHASLAESVIHLSNENYAPKSIYFIKGRAHFSLFLLGDLTHLDPAIDYLEKASPFFDTSEEDVYVILHSNLGKAYLDKATQAETYEQKYLKKALAPLEKILQVLTPEKDGEFWAEAAYKLGVVLFHTDEPPEQNEYRCTRAIDLFEACLCVYDKAEYPIDWLNIKLAMGAAHLKLATPNSPKHFELAIENLEEGLSTIAWQEDPQKYGRILKSLADGYRERITGSLSDNTEKAISLYIQSLQHLTKEKDPLRWGIGKINLGVAYHQRIKFDRADNMEKCLDCYQEALTVFTEKEYPDQWAAVKHNLGADIKDRVYGEKADNLERSLSASKDALKIRTKKEYPYKWAGIMHNIGNTYVERIKGDHKSNLSDAVNYFLKSLEVRTKKEYITEWIDTSMSLANCYTLLSSAGEKQFLSTALQIGHEIEELEVGLPSGTKIRLYWLLSTCYMDDGGESNTYNETKATQYLQKALDEVLPDGMTQTLMTVSYRLANIFYKEQAYQKAIEVLEKGRQAGESERSEQFLNVSKEKSTANLADIYDLLIDCCLKLSWTTKAFDYVIAAKGRTLTEKLVSEKIVFANLAAKNPLLLSLQREIEDLYIKIDNIRHAMSNMSAIFTSDGRRYVNIAESLSLSQELDECRDELLVRKKELFTIFPSLEVSLSLAPATTVQLQLMAQDLNTCLVDFFHFESGTAAFICSADKISIAILNSSNGHSAGEVLKWIYEIETGIATGSQLIRQKRVLQKLFNDFIDPLLSYLPDRGKLLIAPHLSLHYTPLNLALSPEGKYFFEMFDTTYISNMNTAYALWKQKQEQEKKTISSLRQRALVISHSGSEAVPLLYTKEEATFVQTCFTDNILLEEEQATPAQVISLANEHHFNLLHFCCHGRYRVDEPLRSGLEINGLLSVEKILFELILQGEPLVALSACETSRSKIGAGDELNGLNQAFLQAGARIIISSLWRISDAAARDFFALFYKKIGDKSEGLNRSSVIQIFRETMQELRRRDDEKSAFSWGAFQLYGLP